MSANFIPYEDLTAEERECVDSKHAADRIKAALQRHGCDKLINDSVKTVAAAAAASGYFYTLIAHDDDDDVRSWCAKCGYALDLLADDASSFVRGETYAYLRRVGMTLDAWIDRYPERCALSHDAETSHDENRKTSIADISVDAKQRAKEANAKATKKKISAGAKRIRYGN